MSNRSQRNLAPLSFTPPSRANSLQDSLVYLYTHIDERADAIINWYSHRKGRPVFLSRMARGFAIVFTVVDGLIPLLQSAGISSA